MYFVKHNIQNANMQEDYVGRNARRKTTQSRTTQLIQSQQQSTRARGRVHWATAGRLTGVLGDEAPVAGAVLREVGEQLVVLLGRPLPALHVVLLAARDPAHVVGALQLPDLSEIRRFWTLVRTLLRGERPCVDRRRAALVPISRRALGSINRCVRPCVCAAGGTGRVAGRWAKEAWAG